MKLKMIEYRLCLDVLDNVHDKYNYYDRLTGVSNKKVKNYEKYASAMHRFKHQVSLSKGTFFPDSVPQV